MLNAAAPALSAPMPKAPLRAAAVSSDAQRRLNRVIADELDLLSATVSVQRRLVHAGEPIYRAGDLFDKLFVTNSGFNKIVNLASDGREQVVSLKFRGDWLGLDGIASGRFTCDAIALETGEVWAIPYQSLLTACLQKPQLLTMLHAAMSREIGQDRESLMSLCTLPADARVAGFLRYWSDSVADRGMRADLITLHMTRSEIGNYLGLTLETVSRALSRLARDKLIQFLHKGGREIRIPQLQALDDFVLRAQCH